MKLNKILGKCIHYKQMVEHVNWKGQKPNCMTCDGFGVDAKKNNWVCYDPMVHYKKRNDKYTK